MKKLIFFISLSLLVLVGCEKNYERTIWINPDVECCGVKDPINNLEWINNLYNLYEKAYCSKLTELEQPVFIFSYKNDTTQENFVVTNVKGEYDDWITIYQCNGDEIDSGVYRHKYENSKNTYSNDVNATPLPPCFICDEFFQTHTLMDTIAYFIVEP